MKTRWIVGAVLVAAMICILPALAEEAKPADGKSMYASKCAMCHGADGVAKPMAKGAANFNDAAFQAKATVDEITKVILDGKGKMPKNTGKITPEQAKAIAEYVKAMAPAK